MSASAFRFFDVLPYGRFLNNAGCDDMPRHALGEFEQMILLAVVRLE